MFSKLVLAVCLVVASVAFPDEPVQRGYGYQAPQNAYSAPQKTYVAPQKTYVAPQETYVAPQETYAAPKSSEEEDVEEMLMPFNYAYNVRDEDSGASFSHNTDSDGDLVKGEYRVELPDGRTQIVKYTSSKKDGYQAEVTYEGEAREYIAPKKEESAPRNTYAAPEKPNNIYAPPQAPQKTYGSPTQ